MLTELGIGEALYGGLSDKGTPEMVRRVFIAPPQSRVGVLLSAERAELMRISPLLGYYEKAFDRISAYEVLAERTEKQVGIEAENDQKPKVPGAAAGVTDALGGIAGQVYKSALRQAVNQISRQIVRGILGSFTGKR